MIRGFDLKVSTFRSIPNTKIEEKEIERYEEIDTIWNKLRESIEWAAEEVCGKEQRTKKQNWMTTEILSKMEERRIRKHLKYIEQYKKLKHEIQRLCREAKDKYYEDTCREIEYLDKTYNQLLYKRIQEMRPKSNRMVQMIKSKQGNCIIEKDEVLERWLSM